MKQLMNKINNLSTNQKIGIVGCLVIVLLVVSLLPSFSSTETGYLNDQSVDGLTFENAKLEFVDGVSTYTVNVVNDLEEEYQLKNINIIFKDTNNKEIVTLFGYIGDNLEIDEKKELKASVDQEINNIVSIEYVINK